MKRVLLIVLIVLSVHHVFAQGDDPCSATNITVNAAGACSFSTYDNTGSTDSGEGAPGCGSYGAAGEDVWFVITIPASGNVTLDTDVGGITDACMEVYTGNNCNSLTAVGCDDDGSANGAMPMLALNGLTPGDQLWIRIWEYGGGTVGTFDLCAYEPAAATNDECADAIPLTVNPDDLCGTVTPGTVSGATASPEANGCGGTADDDVWFSFVAQETEHEVDLLNIAGSTTDMYHSVYEGPCGALTEISCNDANNTSLTGLTPGQTYYVRVYTWTATGGQTSTFDICVGYVAPTCFDGIQNQGETGIDCGGPCPACPPPPSNDECVDAIPLTVNADDLCGSVTPGTVENATPSAEATGCGGTADDDVWFSFVATETEHEVDLLNIAGSTTDMYHSVYEGPCGSLTEISCNDLNNTSLTGLTPGQTYYIRVYTWTSTTGQTSTFDVCVGFVIPTCSDGIQNQGELYVDCGGPNCPPCPPPTVQDCEGAIPICQDTYSEANAYSGTGNIPNEINNSSSCLGSGEKNDVWYIFTVLADGDLNFSITPNDMADDYDWAVYDISNQPCSDIYTDPSMEVSCNFSGTPGITGPNGDGDINDEPVIPVTAGQTFLINVSQYSTSTNGYTIDFGASTASIFDDVPPVFESVDLPLPCGATEMTFHFNENVDCSSVETADFYLNGPGGPYNITAITSAVCASGGDYDDDYTITINPPLTTSGTFTIGMDATASGSVTDICGNTAPSNSFNFDINNITTIPSQTDLLCNGDANGVAIVNLDILGTADYTYAWSTGLTEGPTSSTSSTVTGLSGGSVDVTVTDALGCQTIQAYTIIEPVAMILTLTPSDATCGSANGSIAVSVTNGVSPYDIDWSPGAQANNQSSPYTITGLLPQAYGVTVTDDNGCTISDNTTVLDAGNVIALIAPEANQCFVGNSFTFDASGSTTISSPTYSWNFGDGSPAGSGVSPTHSYTTPGTYNVTLTLTDGSCSDTYTITVNVLPEPTVIPTPTDASCNGYSDGSISIVIDQGTGPLQNISWSPSGGTSTTASGLGAGTYSVTFEDANGCPGSATGIVIGQPDPMVLDLTSTNADCNTSCDGTASANVSSGGTGPFDYDWGAGSDPSNSATTGNLCGLAGAAGGNQVYTVTVTDDNGCTTTGQVSIFAPAALVVTEVSASHVNVDCNGNSTGTLEVSVSGGTATYEYSLDGGTTWQNNADFSGLSAGLYTITVRDANGCTQTINITITEPDPLGVSEIIANHQDVSCNGGSNGSLTVQATDGTGPYEYSIDGGTTYQSSGTFSGLSVGFYTITVRDDHGCLETINISISEPPVLTASIPAVALSCNGACNGQATVNAGGGSGSYTYAWSNGGSSSNVSTATLCGGTTYTVTVYDANDAGCFVTATVIPTEPPVLTASAVATDASCNGVCDAQGTVTPGGGSGSYTYAWSNGGSTTSISTATLCGDGTVYTVTVYDANDPSCFVTTTVTPIQPAALLVTEVSASHLDVDCNGNSTGALEVSVSGGIATYEYSLDGGTTWQNNADFSGLSAGLYTITVRDANGCTQTINITITEPDPLGVSEIIANHQDVSCNGGSNGSLTVQATDGTGPYEYSIDGGTTYQSSGTFSGLSVGFYTITVRDDHGCLETINISISEPPVLTASIPAVALSCNGACNGQATVNAGGGSGSYTYAWSNGGSSSNVSTATLCGGTTYTVTVYDANDAGCFVTATVIPTEPPVLTASAVATDASCNGVCDAQGTVTPGGGSGSYTYAWSNGGSTTSISTATLCGDGTVYTVTVYDANDPSCFVTTTVTPIQPAALLVTEVSASHLDVDCNGNSTGALEVSVSGGIATYEYSLDGGTTWQNNADFSGLSAGLYTITVRDANGCTQTINITITEPDLLGVSEIIANHQDVSCNGGSNGSLTVQATDGTGPYEYSIDGGTTYQPSGTFSGLSVGPYTITVRDSHGCIETINISIIEPPVLTASIPAVVLDCNGVCDGQATVSEGGGSGSYTYAWSNGGSTTGTSTATLCGDGTTYTVTVYDANDASCFVTATVTPTQPAPISITTSFVNANCGQPDGEVDILPVTGGTGPYTYSWENNVGTQVGTTAQVTGLLAGTYYLTVTDVNGCEGTATATINNNTAGTLSVDLVVDVNCNGGSDGSIDITTSGMTPVLSYAWTGPSGYSSTSEDISGLSAGTYTIEVTDGVGCVVSSTATVNEPPAITATATLVQDVSCNGGSDGSVTVTTSGGTVVGGYTYEWFDNTTGLTTGQTTQTASGLPAGDYYVVVSDNATPPCTFTTPVITIGEPSLLTAGAVVSSDYNGEDISCNGAFDGSIDLTVSDGSPTYTYSWTGPNGFVSAFEDLTGLESGTYDVTVEDSHGCQELVSITLTEPVALSATTGFVNANCGQADGEVDVPTVNGGTGSYTYNWEDNTGTQVGTTAQVTGLLAGTYDVTVSDANGCTVVSSATIGNNSAGTISVDLVVDVNCNGGSDGSIDITTSGMTPALGFVWTGPSSYSSSNEDISGLSAGTYTIEVTDGVGCVVSSTATVNEPPAITATATLVQDVSCNGGSDGSVTVTTSGGTVVGGYTYEWFDNTTGLSTGQTSQTATGLPAGDYYVLVSDNATPACTFTTNVISISEPTLLTASALVSSDYNGEDISCNGAFDGSIDLSVSDGSPTYTYSWTGPNGFVSAFEDLSGLEAGTYDVTVEDSHGCQAFVSITLTEPVLLTASTSFVNANCGQADGEVDVPTVSGGTGAYTYNWEDNTGTQVGTTAQVTGLLAGTYDVTVSDVNGCIVISSATIGNNTAGTLTVDMIVDVNCNGGSDGSIDITTSGMTPALSFVWTGPSSYSSSNEDISGLSAGTYTIEVTDGVGCVVSSTATVNEPPAITATATLVQDVSCNGGSDGSVTVTTSGGTVVGGYTYEWFDNTTGLSTGQTSQTATGLPAGDYYVLVSDNATPACTFTTNVISISEPTLLTASALVSSDYNGEDISCNGAFDGSIDLSVSDGSPTYTYSWTGPNGFVSAFEDLSGLEAGTYDVTVEDSHGCQAFVSITLTEPILLTVTTVAIDAHCGQSDGSVDTLSLNGGTAGFTYNWEDNTGTQVGTTPEVTGLLAGDYDLTVTDVNGCESYSNVTINDLPGPNDIAIVIDQEVSVLGLCDGQATVSMTGAVSYEWYTDNTYSTPLGQSTATATGLCAQEYCVIVSDANGCTDQACITIPEPGAVLISSVLVHDSCYAECQGEADITASGGIGAPYTYVWENDANPGVIISTNEDITSLCAGDYTVTASDANGGFGIHHITITEPTQLTSSIVVSSDYNGEDISCNGAFDGSIDLTISDGSPTYTYNWSGPNGFTTTNEDPTGLEVGTYFVTATDANGCEILSNISLTEPTPVLVQTIAIDAHCGLSDGSLDTLSVQGGTGPYTYQWEDMTSSQVGVTSQVIDLPSGTYNLSVIDANGCVGTSSVSINDIPAGISSVVVDQNSSCNGVCDGQATVSIAGGGGFNNYVWSNGDLSQTASDLCANTWYYVTATDAWGCDLIDSIQTTEPSALSNSFINIEPVLCYGSCDGFAQADPQGGTAPYTYQWDASSLSNADTVDGLCAEWYHVTITDNQGCNLIDSIEFSEPLEIALSWVVTDANCNQDDGAIDLTVTNGTPPFVFTWSNGETTEDIDTLISSNYSVVVSDLKGCEQTATISVGNLDGPTAYISDSTMIHCHGICSGTATVEVSGGLSPYSYTWDANANNQSTQTATNLCAGQYDVTVSDANGCTVPLSVVITQPDTLNIQLTANHPDCHGDYTGSINTLVNGGTAPYTFAWDLPATTQNLNNISAGFYSITVTDTLGCTIQDTITLVDPPILSLSIAYDEPNCFEGNDGSAWVTAIGGTVSSTYGYSWNDANTQTTDTASGLASGLYQVVVSDDLGCQDSITVNITEPTALVASIGSYQDPQCFGSSDGFITVNVSGATPTYTFAWSNGGSSQTIQNLSSGGYIVTVEDAQGCSTIVSQVLSNPDELVVSLNSGDETCFGYSDGWVHSTTVGGTISGNYQYQWSNFLTTADIDNVPGDVMGGPMTYSLTVTDDQGCTDTASAVVVRPPLLSVIDIVTIQSHCNQADGSAELGITGGTLHPNGFVYEWQDNTATTISTTLEITDVTAGTYYFTVTDGLGCQATESVNISDLSAPVVEDITGIDVTCHGLQNGQASVTISGGVSPYSFEWDDDNSQSMTNTSNLSHTAYSLNGGTYSVEVTDAAGCVVSDNITIFEPDTLIASINDHYNVQCNGGHTGWALVQHTGGVGPYTYLWDDNLPQITAMASDLGAGLYSVIVEDNNGCTNSTSVVISEPSSLAYSLNISDPLCYGDTNGVISVYPQGGTAPYSYTWSISGVGDVSTVGSLSSGQYNLVINDAHYCSEDTLITVGQPDPISFDYTTISETCDSDNGQVIITNIYGGTAGYDISISPNPNGFAVTNASSATIPMLTDGNYNISIIDDHNCPYTEMVNLSRVVPPTLNLLVQEDVSCYGYTDGVATVNTLNGTSAFTYNWDNGEEGATAVALSNGTHSVVVTDADGCTDDLLVDIGQPEPITIIADGPSGNVCINQATSLTVNASGGTPSYTFTWINPNLGTGQNVITYPEGDQTFYVYAEDANGCPSTDTVSVSITTYPLISINLVDSLEICQGDQASATAFASGGNGGPYAYNWSNSTYTESITVIPVGTTVYQLDVTDGCSTPTAEDSLTVVVHDAPLVNAISGTDGCESHTAELLIEATSTDGDIEYSWNYDDGNTSNATEFSTAIHTYMYAGVYHPSVHMVSENGCTTDTTVEVNVYPLPVAGIGANHTIVDILDSEIEFTNLTEISSEEPLYWNWSFGDSLGSQEENPVHIYQKVGEYVVYLTATSSHGCVDTSEIPIRVDDHFVIYFPNAFTPESGRGNNYFYPKGVGADTQGYKMTIYDRWGEPIFETTDLPSGFNERYEEEGGWNGRYRNSGPVVQNGVYTWVVKIKDVNGINHEYSGTVTVIR